MGQLELIKKHLESGASITEMEALNRYKCNRLASRITDLKQAGMNIHREMVKINGKSVARYTLLSNVKMPQDVKRKTKIIQVVIEPTRVSVTYLNGQTKHHYAKGWEDAYNIAKRAYKGEV